MTRVAAMLDGGDGSDVLWWVLEEAGPAQPSGLDYAALLRAYRCASDAHAAAALRTQYAPPHALLNVPHTLPHAALLRAYRCASDARAAAALARSNARGQQWGAC